MSVPREKLEDVLFGGTGSGRYTEDSPIRPEVWIEFGKKPQARADLLLTPVAGVAASHLMQRLRERLAEQKPSGGASGIAYTDSYVAVHLSFDELIWAALPLTAWWDRHVVEAAPDRPADLGTRVDLAIQGKVAPQETRSTRDLGHLEWLMRLVGTIAREREREPDEALASAEENARSAAAPLIHRALHASPAEPSLLSLVSRNRPAYAAVSESRSAVKADAAIELFGGNTRGLRWAVLDSGIDRNHPAFGRRDGAGSRVVKAYDFTKLRGLQATRLEPHSGPAVPPVPPEAAPELRKLERDLKDARAIEWDIVAPLLEDRQDQPYEPPAHQHGTHVAGILAGDWRTDDPGMPEADSLIGICPELELFDLRVLGDEGTGEEFTILAALQFVRHLNSRSERLVIHGVNLSLSLHHDVLNYAAGRTPICEECERVVAGGAVVVAAAGNQGYTEYRSREELLPGYRGISITDPGNAEGVITVGATHRSQPHAYGVSYFSSRGPTGDGRYKPDLVAPGQNILAPVPRGGAATLDGTSAAAPHVSGAAALLLGRHRELIGNPAQVKAVLCKTATDLGRERYFQGFGLVDALRALQAV